MQTRQCFGTILLSAGLIAAVNGCSTSSPSTARAVDVQRDNEGVHFVATAGSTTAKVTVTTSGGEGSKVSVAALTGDSYEISISPERRLRLDYASRDAHKRYFVQHVIVGATPDALLAERASFERTVQVPSLDRPFDGEVGDVPTALLSSVLTTLRAVAASGTLAERQLVADLVLGISEVQTVAPSIVLQPYRVGPSGQPIAVGVTRQGLTQETMPVDDKATDCAGGATRVPRGWSSTCLESDLAVPGYFSAHVTVGKAKGTSLCCPTAAPGSSCKGKFSKQFEVGTFEGCPDGYKDWRYTITGGISAVAEQTNPDCLADTINDEASAGKVKFTVLGIDVWSLTLFSDTGDMMTCQWANVGGSASFCGKGAPSSDKKDMRPLNETFIGQAGKDRECEWVDWTPPEPPPTQTTQAGAAR
jgi:hypothetical protein